MLNLIISPEPCDSDVIEKIRTDCVAVINVADTPCSIFESFGVPQFWFPIDEIAYWGYAPFFAAAKICDHFTKVYPHPNILINCHAGVNRSRSVAYATYRTFGVEKCKLSRINVFGKVWELEAEGIESAKEQFDMNVQYGHVPENLIDFLNMRYMHPEYSLGSLLSMAGVRDIERLPRKFLEKRLSGRFFHWINKGVKAKHRYFGLCEIIDPRFDSKFATVKWLEINSDYPSDVEKILLDEVDK